MSWKKINNKKLFEATNKCDSSNIEIFKNFVNANYIISYKNGYWHGTTIKRFLENGGRIAGTKYISLKNQIPNIDHEHIYRNIYNDVLIVSHSYNDEDKILEQFNEWNDGSFKIDIFGKEKSWYYPNETTLFVITLKDVQVKN